MAKLKLGEYELELILDKVWVDIGLFDYKLAITCGGVNVIAPWRRETFKDPKAGGLLFCPAEEPFDECFRPLLNDEWPIHWSVHEAGHWVSVSALPSAFMQEFSFGSWGMPTVDRFLDLAKAIRDREEDEENRRSGTDAPKKFKLKRDPDDGKIYFSFQINRAAMGMPPDNYDYKDGWANMAFEAAVDYGALRRFLNALERERKIVEKRDAREREKQEEEEARLYFESEEGIQRVKADENWLKEVSAKGKSTRRKK